MAIIRAKQALLPAGWVEDVCVTVGENGHIESVQTGPGKHPLKGVDHEAGILLPAPVNVHSHAFQRAMAGLTEARGGDPRDSFRTWRQ